MELLDDQYRLTEKYVNCQTLLFNTTIVQQGSRANDGNAPDVGKAVSAVHHAKYQVRSNFESIQNNAAIVKRYPEHIALTRRVLRSISNNPLWTTLGIPNGNSVSSETHVVALATLKASIALLHMREAESDTSAVR